jgi:hypothetical protein
MELSSMSGILSDVIRGAQVRGVSRRREYLNRKEKLQNYKKKRNAYQIFH